jgi:hypothetical protein
VPWDQKSYITDNLGQNFSKSAIGKVKIIDSFGDVSNSFLLPRTILTSLDGKNWVRSDINLKNSEISNYTSKAYRIINITVHILQ